MVFIKSTVLVASKVLPPPVGTFIQKFGKGSFIPFFFDLYTTGSPALFFISHCSHAFLGKS